MSSQTVELYGGEVELRITDSHIYYVDKAPSIEPGFPVQVYGASAVAKVLTGPDQLMWWAVNCAVEELDRQFELEREKWWQNPPICPECEGEGSLGPRKLGILNRCPNCGGTGANPDGPYMLLDEVRCKEIGSQIKMAHRSKSDKAANLGTAVHKWVADHLTGKEPRPMANKDGRAHCEEFLRWAKEVELEAVENERMVLSLEHGYAGTLDMIAKVEGRLSLIDMKVSSGVYDGAYVQTAGYRMAWREEEKFLNGEAPELDRWTLLLNKRTGRFKAYHMPDHERDQAAFLGALHVYKWLNWRRDGKPENPQHWKSLNGE